MLFAPVVLFVYNRPWHTKQTLEALNLNEHADKSILFIYADGPKKNASPDDLQKIKEVRKIIREKQWCGEVKIVESENNEGLAKSIIFGVTEIVNKYNKIIVLEDDLITSRGFLKYMNDALNLYEDKHEVMHISGYMFPVNINLPDTFFLNNTSCWGWGVWARSWNKYIDDAQLLQKEILDGAKLDDFTLGFSNNYDEMLQKKITGKIDSWAICWAASVFIMQGFCLHPCISLVRNIGHDSSGLHCNDTWWSKIYSNQKIIDHVKVELVPIIENEFAVKALRKHYMKLKKIPFLVKLKEKIKIILKKKKKGNYA